jgi:hypothetical protein
MMHFQNGRDVFILLSTLFEEAEYSSETSVVPEGCPE